MTDAVELHDHRIQKHLEGVVRDVLDLDPSAADGLFPLSADAIIALVFLGRTPPALRPATLTILPAPERFEFDAHKLARFHDADQVEWSMTALGDQLADALAGTVTNLPAHVRLPPATDPPAPRPVSPETERPVSGPARQT